jgi:hypothetical protein
LRSSTGDQHFNENQDEAVKYISTHLDFSEMDAREWLKTVKFTDVVEGAKSEVVKNTEYPKQGWHLGGG